jgi:DNA-binding MarR family transcriptional regulator
VEDSRGVAPGASLLISLADYAALYRHCELEAARASGLRLSDYRCLVESARQPEIHIKELVRRSSFSSSRASVILDRLERRRLIRRQVDPADRREVIVRVTPRGQRVVRGGLSALLSACESALRNAGPVKTLAARELIQELSQALGEALPNFGERTRRLLEGVVG